MKRFAVSIAAIVFLSSVPIIASAQDEVSHPTLIWAGCGISKKAYMSELARSFEELTGVRITLLGGGASRGIRGVASGEIQMGGSCRLRLRNKNGKVHPLEADSSLHQVAWDAIVVITHPSNSVKSISMANLRKIYQGEITNWTQLGGDDQPIKIVAREGNESGVGYMFRRYAFSDPDLEFPATAILVKSSGPLERIVESQPYTLAVDGVSSANRSNVKILRLDGTAPTKENIATGKYYMFRPLFLTVDTVSPDTNTLNFVEYALSEEGQSIISNAGTVNLQEGAKLNSMWTVRRAKLGL